MEVVVTESFKMKWQLENGQREQMTRKWKGKGGKEDRNCDGELH